MPQSLDPDALARLRTMITPSNMGRDTNPRFARRRADIYSGIDDLVPGADSAEAKIAQVDVQRQHGIGVSRDALREGPMALLRQKLKFAQQENDAALNKAHVEGQYGVREQEAAGRAAADRLAYTQDQINSRSEANHAAVMSRLDKQLESRSGLQEDRQQFEVEHPNAGSGPTVPAPLYKALTDAEGQLPGNPLSKMLWGKSREQAVMSALEAILDRQGVLPALQQDLAVLSKFSGTLDERIAQAGANPAGLSPYERKWLERRLAGN